MTTYSTKIRTSSTIRFCGQLCLLAGVLGAASSVYLAFYSPAVPEDMWSYPQTPAAFAGMRGWLAVQHLGLLAGLFALWWSGAAGSTRLGRIGHASAAAGVIGWIITEVTAITARHDPDDTTLVALLGASYGLFSLFIGVGLILEGIAVVRARIWDGWRRWLPLALGIWVFVPLMPAMGMTVEIAEAAMAGWMLLFAALGWSLATLDRRQAG
jgi:hypothetical protein